MSPSASHPSAASGIAINGPSRPSRTSSRPVLRQGAKPSVIALTPATTVITLDEHQADASVSFAIIPAQGYNPSFYTPFLRSTNDAVLRTDDIRLAPPLISTIVNTRNTQEYFPVDVANYTAVLEFDQSVGVTEIIVDIFFDNPRLASSFASNHTVSKSSVKVFTIAFQFIVCGLSFYYPRVNGTQTLLPGGILNIPSFQSVLTQPVIDLQVLVQLPPGIPSSAAEFSKLHVSVQGDRLLPGDASSTCLHDHARLTANTSNIVLPTDCPFGFTPYLPPAPTRFGVRLQKYRTGSTTFLMVWPGFGNGASASSLLSEVLETSLTIVIQGEAGVSVVDVFPDGPFRQGGGDLLSCTVINARPGDVFTFRLESTLIKPMTVHNNSDAGLTLTFVTPPGEGQNVPWDLLVHRGNKAQYACPWTGSDPRFVFRYNMRDVHITSIDPSFGPEAGGIRVTCTGYFADFNTSRDAIFLDSHSLAEDRVVSVNLTAIVFTLPPFTEVNSPRRDIQCVITVAGVRTNAVKFSYETLTDVSISITGGSAVSSSFFQVPVCRRLADSPHNTTAVIAVAKLNAGVNVQRISFEWIVVETLTKRQILTTSGGTESQLLPVPVESLVIDVAYDVSVTVKDMQLGSRVSSKVRLQAVSRTAFGVTLVAAQDERSIQVPAVDARLTAAIVPHGDCMFDIGTPSMSFEWTFAGVTSVLSYDSAYVDTSNATPRRLGREFVIPRGRLAYGRHRVDVTTFVSDTGGARSSAFVWMDIVPAPLRAIIGSGESSISVSDVSDIHVSGGASYDPDEPARKAEGLSFSWECELSVQGGSSFAQVASCPEEVFPPGIKTKQSFTLKASSMRSLRKFNNSIFVRYALVVTKRLLERGVSQTRTSARTFQIVEIVEYRLAFAERPTVSITTVDGYKVDVSNTPYYEDILITPRGLPGTSWRFSLKGPSKESSGFLKKTENLLQLPGMYNPKSSIASTGALGIRSGAMRPETEYVFRLESNSVNARSTSIAEVSIRTMVRPSVALTSVQPTSGSTKTVFTAVASSTPNDWNFKFLFYVQASDGSEICVDGCSGARQVQFRLPVGGKYQLRVTLVDARGKLVIARGKENVDIEVSQYSADDTDTKLVSKHGVELVSVHLAEALSAETTGDHAAFVMACLAMAEAARTTADRSIAAWEMVASAANDAVMRLSLLYNKTQPSTECSRDYMTVAAAFARLKIGNSSVLDTEGILSLCAMAVYAVRNTPRDERLDVLDQLNATLSAVANAARVIAAGGSTRGRLLAEANGVNSVLLELSEFAVPAWVEARNRGSACGSVWDEPVGGGLVRVTGGTFCTAEQGQKVTGKHSALAWCTELFGKNGEEHRISAVLGEFFDDYIADSRILELRRRTTNLATKGGRRDGKDVSVDTTGMASHSKAITRAIVVGGAEHVIDNGRCVTIQQTARPTMEIFKDWDGAVLCPRVSGMEYIDRKQLNETVKEDMYRERALSDEPNASSEITPKSHEDERQIVSLIEERDGVYGVKYGGCIHRKAATVGVIVGAWLVWVALILVMVAMVSGTASGVWWVTKSKAVDIVPVDENFIERDIYGREAYGQEVFVTGPNDGDSEDSNNEQEEAVTETDLNCRSEKAAKDYRDVLVAGCVDISEADNAGSWEMHADDRG